MELSRERKIFVMVAGVAAAAFVIDRGVLGESQAAAGPILADVPLLSAGTPGQAGEQLGGIDQTGAEIARRIRALVVESGVEGDGSGDAFAIPAEWTAPPQPIPDADGASVQSTPVPRPTFQLSAAMPTKRGGIAVIDGRTYRTGERIGAYTLASVTDRAVTLDGPAGVISLEVER